jgi:hypothetical protein
MPSPQAASSSSSELDDACINGTDALVFHPSDDFAIHASSISAYFRWDYHHEKPSPKRRVAFQNEFKCCEKKKRRNDSQVLTTIRITLRTNSALCGSHNIARIDSAGDVIFKVLDGSLLVRNDRVDYIADRNNTNQSPVVFNGKMADAAGGHDRHAIIDGVLG